MIKWKRWVTSFLRFLGGVSLIFIIVVSILFIAPDSAYQRLLTWTVQTFTDYRLVIDGPFSLDMSLMPTMTISDFRIEHDKNGAQPFSAHFGRLRTRLDIKPFLFRVILVKELLVEDATVSFVAGEGIRPEEIEKWAPGKKLDDIDIPILESVNLRNVDVSYFDKDTEFSLKLNLRSFAIDDVRDDGPLYVRGEGAMNNADFTIEGQLGSLADALKRTRPHPINLKLNVADLGLILSGTVDDLLEGEGLHIRVSAEGADLSNILKVVGVDIPELGHLNLHGTITGSVEAPGFSDFNMAISGGNKVEFSAKGSAANLISGDGTNIAISGSTSNRDVIRMLLPEELHDFDEFTFKGRLRNVQGDYALEDVSLSAGQDKRMTIKANGSVVLGGTMVSPEIKRTDLRLYLTAQNTKPLKSYLFDWLPDTGPVTGEAQLIGTAEQLALENLNITAGEPGTVWINAKGRLGGYQLIRIRKSQELTCPCQ